MRHNARLHPGFVDMAGKVCGTWTVIERMPNIGGNALWRCQHSCGAVHAIQGIRLRRDPPIHCADCRPKRAGTVERIAV